MPAELKPGISNRSGKPIIRCTGCGNIAYTTEQKAREAAARVDGFESYLNQSCGWFHLRPETIVPRDYQEAAHESIYTYFKENKGNPIIAMPTGTGKSVVIADFIRRACLRFPGTRVVSLTHVKELIEQNYTTLIKVWPTAPSGVYSAGLGRRDSRQPITFAGIQSVYKRAHIFGKVDLIIIDECHLVSPKGESMYGGFIAACREVNPHVKVIGFSATPYRLKHGMLTDDDGIFTDVAFDLTSREAFNWLVAQNHISPLIPRQGKNAYDVSGVKVHGDYVLSQLQAKVDVEDITLRVLHEAVPLAEGRKHWLTFCSGIDHSEHVADCLNDVFNIPAAAVHSQLSIEERDDRIASFKRGELVTLVNNNILTTGFDAPFIDLILMLRPTQSPGLWVQMLGRGTRPFEGKVNCVVLDFANNTKRLGPINDPVLPKQRGRGPPMPAPVRLCEHCMCYSHASCKFCEICGAEFPRNLKLTEQPSIQEVIAGDIPQIHTYDISNIVYRIHNKKGRPDSMRVDYYCGLRRFSEFVCLDHKGYALRVAENWWRQRCVWGVPPSVADGMKAVDHLLTPIKVNVLEKKRYPEICGYEFD